MQCPRCHAEISDQLRFCPTCGCNVEDLAEKTVEEPDAQTIDDLDEDVVTTVLEGETFEVVDIMADDIEPEPEVVDPEPDFEYEEELEFDFEPEPELVLEVEPEPVLEPKPVLEPEPVPDPEPELVLEVEPEPAPRYETTEADYVVEEDAYAVEPDTSTNLVRHTNPEADDVYGHAKAYERGGIRALLKRWRTVLVVLGCVIALVLAGISSVEWNNAQKQKEEAEASAQSDVRTSVPIGVAIDLEGYDENIMTPIPLRVKGSAATGEAVDELVLFTHPNVDALSLLKGTYIVELGGPVLSNQGDLFEGTVDSFSLAILDGGITVNGRGISPDEKRPLHFVFTRIEPQNVTDGVLDMARSWMLKAEIVNYQSYVDAVIAKRQEAFDRLAAEQAAKEEAEKKAAEEAAKAAEEQRQKEEAEKQKQQDQQNASTDESSDDSQSTGDEYGGSDSSNTDGYGDNSYDSSNYGYDSYGYDSTGYDGYYETY